MNRSNPSPKQSSQIHFNFRRKLDRRTVLRGTGVAMALPMLTAMESAYAGSQRQSSPKRFVGIGIGLGLVAKNLFPAESGKDYQSTPYLESVRDLRDSMTIISGSSHPGVKGGHRALPSIFTASPIGVSGRSTNTISLDQLMAKHLGDDTRYPSLVLSTSGSTSLSYTESGAMIPPQDSPQKLFDQLFTTERRSRRKLEARRIRQGRSIMELVGEDAKSLAKTLGIEDRRRLGEYFASVRELEKRMAKAESWAERPKPKVKDRLNLKQRPPSDPVGSFQTMCDLMKLALQTDSSRFMTLYILGSGGVVPIEGVQEGYHSLSHHGLDDNKLRQLALVESAIVKQWGDFVRALSQTDDGNASLLDHTNVVMTSNLGNASNHDNRNMPVLLAGGGFRHAGHLAFDRKNNHPLSNLYLSILQSMGLETNRFATSTGTMPGLDLS